MYKLSVVASTVVAFSLSSPVNALPVDALDLLSSFNVITLGDLNTGVHTEGTAYIGGDLNLTGSYDVNTDRLSDGQAGDVSGALIVGGDINGNSTINFVNGDVVVGGDINVAINRADSITSGADVPAADVAAELLGLSSLLSELPDTDGTSINRDQNDQNIFSGAGVDGVAIVSAPEGFLASGGANSGFNGINSAITTIVNIAGLNPTLGANIESIFLDNVLLNFFEAETLNITSGVSLSILAPSAVINVGGGGINGTVVGDTIFQNAEIRPFGDDRLFSGTLPEAPTVAAVPLPASLGLLMSAFGALALFGRRRKMA